MPVATGTKTTSAFSGLLIASTARLGPKPARRETQGDHGTVLRDVHVPTREMRGVEKLVSYRSAELKSQLREAEIPLLVRRRPS